MEGRRPATMFIRLWREKTEINPKVGSLVQVLSLKLTDYKDSREIHSTPSTVLREVSEEQPPTQTDTQAASQKTRTKYPLISFSSQRYKEDVDIFFPLH